MTDLYPWQSDALAFAREHPKCWLALDPGMGKSRVAIERMKMMGANTPTLIVVPPHLKKNWVNEFRLWLPERLHQVQVIEKGTDKPDLQFVIISYAMLVTWMKEGRMKVPPEMLVVDEAHAAKSWSAKRTKAICKLVKATRVVNLLTGTPIVNRPSELGPLLQALGVFKNKKNFEAVYCAGWQAPWGWDATGNSDPEGLRKLLEPVMIRRPKSVMGKITPGRTPPRVLELDVPLGKREKAFDKSEVAKNPNPVAFEGMSELMAWHGEAKAPLAIKHIEDVMESEEKVVVIYWHIEVGRMLAEGLDKGGREVLLINGAVTHKQAVVDQFTEHEGPCVLLLNRAAAVGLNITCASYMVFVEAPWSPGDLDQCISRCDRIGQEEVVRSDLLTISGSIDGHVIHALLDKQETINEVIEKMSKFKANEIDAAVFNMLEVYCDDRSISPEDFVNEMSGVDAPEEKPKATEEKPKAKKAKAKAKPEPKAPEIDLSDLRAAARSHLTDHGGDSLKAILKKFKAANLSGVKEEDYPAVVEALNAD